jgi:hypothetical protein
MLLRLQLLAVSTFFYALYTVLVQIYGSGSSKENGAAPCGSGPGSGSTTLIFIAARWQPDKFSFLVTSTSLPRPVNLVIKNAIFWNTVVLSVDYESQKHIQYSTI